MNQPAARAPEISVVVYMPHHVSVLEPLLRALRAQTARDRIELVIAVRSREVFGATESSLHGLGWVVVVQSESAQTLTSAKIAALCAATAPVIAFAEDHCFPDPTWAQRLIDAHCGDWAGVAPAMRNANPRTALSRSGFLLHFGQWTEGMTAVEMPLLPSHNTSFKRAALMDLLDELPELMPAEHFLHARLVADGHKLLFEPGAVASHCNISRIRPWLSLALLGGRVYGSNRVHHEHLSPTRRLVLAVASPLIPLVRTWRAIKDMRRIHPHGGEKLSVLPLTIAAIVIHTAGEVMGYVAGAGDAEQRYACIEVSRFQDMAPLDVELVRGTASPALGNADFAAT